MTDLVFSHRPLAGVSVGALSENGRLFVAFALVNDGTSRNGIYHDDREDSFSRARARAILESRINTMRTPSGMFVAESIGGTMVEEATPVRFGMSFETPMTSREFMRTFRDTFKPTVDETDEFLVITCEYGFEDQDKIELRIRPQAKQIVSRLETLVQEVI